MADGWQPIETAPEGVPILLWRNVLTSGDDWRVAERIGDGWLDDGNESDPEWFTHWMQLPERPGA